MRASIEQVLSNGALDLHGQVIQRHGSCLPTSNLFKAVQRQITALARDVPLRLDTDIAKAVDPTQSDIRHKRLVMALIATRSQKADEDHAIMRRIAEAIGVHDPAAAIIALFQARYVSLDIDAMNYAVDDERHLFPAVAALIDRVPRDKLALPIALLLDHVDFVDRNKLVVFPEVQCTACVDALRRLMARLAHVDADGLADVVSWMRRRNPNGRLTGEVLNNQPLQPPKARTMRPRKRRRNDPSPE